MPRLPNPRRDFLAGSVALFFGRFSQNATKVRERSYSMKWFSHSKPHANRVRIPLMAEYEYETQEFQNTETLSVGGVCRGVSFFELTIYILVSWISLAGAVSQAVAQEVSSEEERQQLQAADRFFGVLQKAPRRGTALDRVYSHHVEFGSIGKLIQSFQEQLATQPTDGTTWMLLGLFESQRGADAAAVAALKNAESIRAEDALASYYLGQSLIRVGQSEEAVLAFERALTRKPARADLLEIYQQLGRVHQRAQRNDEAVKVWTRLEALFPEDARVLEQIAVTLADEGAFAQAIPRYEKLASITKDDYRRVVFAVEAAQLKVKTDKRDRGLQEFESLLNDLKPDSWLYRDVRRRIEEVFLKSGDQDSLVKYYQKWLETHAEDVEGMARLAKFLTASARLPEASQWMEKALQLAPSRADLRKAFIDQLIEAQKVTEATAQYELLAKAKPGNTDILREWGRLVLKDKSKELALRQQQATDVWNQIIDAKPDDALTLAQVADLFRQSNLPEPAMALYRQAIERAPAEPQYREYLGEYLHMQKQNDEAIKTWASIAEGSRRTASSVARLAEIYNSFGYLDRAIPEMEEACKLDPKDFALKIKASDYLARVNRFDDAFTFLSDAEKLATTSDEKEEVVKQRIQLLQSSDRLGDAIDSLAAETDGAASRDLPKQLLLARYYEAARKLPEAADAIAKAIAIDPKSIETLAIASRIAEGSGDFGQAIQWNRQLAEVDRRARGDYLQNIARLHTQLGQTDLAIAAAQELIISAPGNTEHYEFFAQLCFRLGKPDEGLEALRKAVRINPNEPRLIIALGNALSDQLRTDEAIALYWRAFERSDQIEDKTSLTEKLVPLYTQLNQLEKLTERFVRDQQDEQKRRESTICLAQAYRSSGDTSAARQELESLLADGTRDTNLLQQLGKLCEENGDLDAAVGYQRQLVSIAPGSETEMPLAKMLQQRGDADESNEILVKLTQREEDPARLLKSIDSLLAQGRYDSVIGILEPLLSQQRDNWELLYREGVAWVKKERFDEAKNRFERLLSLKLDHEARGILAEAAFKQQKAKAKSDNLRGVRAAQPQRRSPLTLLVNSSEVRMTTGLDQRYEDPFSGQSMQQAMWAPELFGLARMAAIGWLMQIDQRTMSETPNQTDRNPVLEAIEKGEKGLAGPAGPDSQTYDTLYLAQLENKYNLIFSIARQLARTGGREEKQFFIDSIASRGLDPSDNYSPEPKKNDPLSTEDIQFMTDCVQELAKLEKDANNDANTIQDSEGNTYVRVGNRYVRTGGQLGNRYTQTIVDELKLAGRKAEADKIIEDHIARAKSSREISGVINYFMTTEQVGRIGGEFERWIAAAEADLAKANFESQPVTLGPRSTPDPMIALAPILGRWIGFLGEEEENAQIVRVVDRVLDPLVKTTHMQRIAKKSPRQRPGSMNLQQYTSYVSWNYGKKTQQIVVDYPRANQYLSTASITLLRQTFEVLRRNSAQSDLADLLKKRVAAADETNKLYEQLMLAAVLWWMDDREEALDLTLSASKLIPQDADFQFEMVSMLDSRRDYDDALSTLEAIPALDQPALIRKEQLALSIAERLGDRQRAKSAAERLFSLRLDANTQMGLMESMRRLGLSELADAILARAEKRVGNQVSGMATLMMQLQGQGKTAQAKQLAFSVLNKTKPVLVPVGRMGRNFSSQAGGDSQMRQQALQLLSTTGELSALATKLEAQIERSPESLALYQKLIEIYDASGKKDKSTAVLKLAIERNPNSTAMRLRMASLLAAEGKTKEACDQYLPVIKSDFRMVSNDFYEIQNQFRQAGRTKELAEVIREQNFKQLNQPYYVINLISELLNKDDKDEVALNLAERAFDAFPQYRSNLISQMRSGKVWERERMFALIRRNFTPTTSEVNLQPWSGFSQSFSYSQNGVINEPILQILQGLNDAKKQEVRKLIETSIASNPNWYGGRAFLVVLDAQAKQIEKVTTEVRAFLDDESTRKSMPFQTAWILGAELSKIPSLLKESTDLLELANKNGTNRGMNEFQYTPGYLLAQNYTTMNRKEDAKKILLTAMSVVSSEDDYSNYRSIEGNRQVAKQLSELGYPQDAIKAYSQLLSEKSKFAAAAAFRGNSDANSMETEMRVGLMKAMESVQPEDLAGAIDSLLAPKGTVANKNGSVQLDLVFPNIAIENSAIENSAIEPKPIESQMLQMMVRLVKNKKIGGFAKTRLKDLGGERPQDLAMQILNVAILRAATDEAYLGSLQSLDTFVAEHPLESIPPDRRPNSRQRRDCLNHIGLWLIAKDCLGAPSTEAIGQRLATVALEAAKRQVETLASTALLWEWGKKDKELSRLDHAEAKWTELLTIATQRPQRKPGDAADNQAAPLMIPGRPPQAIPIPNPPGRPPGRPPVRPPVRPIAKFIAWQAPQPPPTAPLILTPLTMTQFRMAILVAQTAHENDLPQLSMKAIKEAFAGGPPVPDPTPASTNTRGRNFVMTTSGGITYAVVNGVPVPNPGTTQLTKTIQVVGKWKPDRYPAEEVVTLLSEIVLPTARPQEIYMGDDSTNIARATVQSLVEQLVTWAKRADKIGDLEQRVETRAPGVAKLVLQGRCAMVRGEKGSALKRMQELVTLVESAPSSQNVTLACHLAMPACMDDELKESAFLILKRAAATLPAVPNANSSNSQSTRLALLVNKYYADQGNEELIRKYFDAQLTANQALYANYGGDYGLQMQKSELANIATQSAMFGSPKLTLDFLGRVVDFESVGRNTVSLTVPFASAVRAIRMESDDKEYKIWSDWTLPNADRQTVRMVAGSIRPDIIPSEFRKLTKSSDRTIDHDLLCNLLELTNAAVASNNLPALREAANQAYEKKLPGGNYLKLMLAIHDQDAVETKQLASLLADELKAKLKNAQQNPQQNPQQSVVVTSESTLCRLAVRAGLFDLEHPLAVEVINFYEKSGIVPLLELDAINRFASDQKTAYRAGYSIPLKHWSTMMDRSTLTNSLELAWWEVLENQLVRVRGIGKSMARFHYPLTGDFDFYASVNQGDGFEFGYDGVAVRCFGGSEQIGSAGENITYNRSGISGPVLDTVQALHIQSKAGTVQFLLNNKKVYERPVEGSNPWISLGVQRNSQLAFANLRIDGSPVIPKSVPLLVGNRLDGWSAWFHGESVFVPPIAPEKKRDEDDEHSVLTQRTPPRNIQSFENGWINTAGVLTAKAQEKSIEPVPSWLYYHRPMRSGEKVSYQFFCQQNESMVYPSIGRTALILSEDDIRLHWIESTNSSSEQIATDNSIADSASRKTKGKLPLKQKDWNKVELAIEGNEFTLTLNGELVFTRPMNPEIDHRFGLFRYQHQSVSVRNMVLTGAWPERLDDSIAKHLLETTSERSETELRVIEFATQDQFATGHAKPIADAVRSMEPGQAFPFLTAWVLPTKEHSSIRLYFDLWNGTLYCPAEQLVSIATKAGKLDELAKKAESCSDRTLLQQRSKQAMLCLIDIERGDIASARARIRTLYGELTSNYSSTKWNHQRSPEFIVAWKAAGIPELANFANDLAARLLQLERDAKPVSTDPKMNQDLASLRRRIESLANKPTSPLESQQTISPLRQWASIQQPNISAGHPKPQYAEWQISKGLAKHAPGTQMPMLIFQSPLSGKFTVNGSVSTFGHREVLLGYKLRSAFPRHDAKAFRKFELPQINEVVEGDLELPRWEDFAEVRVEVDGVRMTTFINDKKLHEEDLVRNDIPWVSLSSENMFFDGQVRNLRILGEPTIPDELELFPSDSVQGWKGTLYSDRMATISRQEDREYQASNVQWILDQTSKELLGTKRPDSSITRESVLQYMRPLLEDGEIEFETFYSPKGTELHPSIGRSAWLLKEDGIYLHRLTRRQFETDDLAPDNESKLVGCASAVPLKANDWNSVKLVVTGDDVMISVNGEHVGTGSLPEPPSERFLGLFHFANTTDSRLRKLIYRGKWPKTLPSVDQQMLAGNVVSPAKEKFGTDALQVSSLIKPLTMPSMDAITAEGWILLGRENSLQAGSQGLNSLLTKGGDSNAWPGIRWIKKLSGDGAIFADFESLQLTPPIDGWGVNAGLFVALDDPEESEFDLSLIRYPKGETHVQAIVWRKDPMGQRKAVSERKFSVGELKDGQLCWMRKDGLASFYYASKTDNELRLVDHFVVGSTPIQSVSLQSKSSDDEGRVEVRWKELMVRGFE